MQSKKSDVHPDRVTAQLKAKVAQLEAEKERKELERQIQQLEAELAMSSDASSSPALPHEERKGVNLKNQESKEVGDDADQSLGYSVIIAKQGGTSGFLLADISNSYAFKSDGATMEAAIFSLSTKPDMEKWVWASQDGTKSVEVEPSFHGRATLHDKDILVYAISLLIAGINKGMVPKTTRTIRFKARDFLKVTGKNLGAKSYDALKLSLARLAGTRIKTNIKTGRSKITKGFGIIDSWGIVEKSTNDNTMVAMELTISEWLHNSITEMEVLTISDDYFDLRKPIERRLYEIARKHCGSQEKWRISLPVLLEKIGSRASIYKVYENLKNVAENNNLPQYEMKIIPSEKIDKIIIEFVSKRVLS